MSSLIGLFYLLNKPAKNQQFTYHFSSFDDEEQYEIHEALQWEFERLKDPLTGKIPENIRREELAFSTNLPRFESFNREEVWKQRGPWNVGGRTRAFALDVTNPQVMLLGSISGGLWRTEDGGKSWSNIMKDNMYPAVSCIIQDTRPGKTHIWYYGTGENQGNSASASFSAYYYGNGIFKSTDGGITWKQAGTTGNIAPGNFTSPFQIQYHLAIDPSDTTDAGKLYAACRGTIMRSKDGGATWKNIFVAANEDADFTSIAISKTGVAYACLSTDGDKTGLYRSVGGGPFAKINPPNTPTKFERSSIAISPENNDVAYFLIHVPNGGFNEQVFYRYTYLSGDGSGAGGQWEDLTPNLPGNNNDLHDFATQGGYDMFVTVKADDPSVVFIGGTNLYRSLDAFNSPDFTSHIGGYGSVSGGPNYTVFNNHHPDNHGVFFDPQQPDVMFSFNDGGLQRAEDCLNDTIYWEWMNRGYITAQFYTLAIDEHTAGSDYILGGLQDNGTVYTNAQELTKNWPMPGRGDGSYCAIAPNAEFVYMSSQNGRIGKFQLSEEGTVIERRRIDPDSTSGYQFIHPFLLDYHNKNRLYLPVGNKLMRCDVLDLIELNGDMEPISKEEYWFELPGSIPNNNDDIISMANCPTDSTKIFVGTRFGDLYRIDHPQSMNPDWVNISGGIPISGYLNNVVVDPLDANHLLAVYSNYYIPSLFETKDGGGSWKNVSGNLEAKPDGSGPGPSLRDAGILHVADGTIFIVGTSTGLYATDALSDTTKWVKQAPELIKNAIVDVVKVRQIDSMVMIGTHGNGVFSAKITSVTQVVDKGVSTQTPLTQSLQLYPNPASNFIEVRIPAGPQAVVAIYDIHGNRLSQQKQIPGGSKLNWPLQATPPGRYQMRVQQGKKLSIGNFIKVH